VIRHNLDSQQAQNGQRLMSSTRHPGHPLRRYYWRALVGCCGPLIITAYYFLTWDLYLNPPESPNGTNFGRAGAQFVLFSWFLLAVVGLDLGEYGLVGVEASMLMTALWSAPSAWHIMMHGEHTWTGIGGWMSTVKSLIVRPLHMTMPTKLWGILATLTALLFVGLPLTGLTMELRDGFRTSNNHPEVVGQRWETFNTRSVFATLAAAQNAWSLAIPPRVPGMGVLYTNSSANRKDANFLSLNTLPNTVPTDEGVTEVFLVPQAETPISGKAWGLIVRYNCTTIQRSEDFTILSRRNGSVPLRDTSTAINFYEVGDFVIEIRNHTVRSDFDEKLLNYKVVSELAYSRETYGDSFFAAENSTQCYFNKSEAATNGYPGLEHDSILELAFWQHATNNEGLIDPPLPPSFYNFSIDTMVASLNGAYSVPSTERRSNSTIPMTAIGVQCKSSSALGSAEIDGITSTYKNFEKSDTPIVLNVFACPPRLSLAVPQLIFNNQDTWPENFFTSAEAPPTFLTSESGDNVVYVTVRPTLLQASELRRSLLRAYGTAAVQLMYDGGQGYSFANTGQRYRIENTNATAFEAAKVLGQGPVPPAIPGVLLALWALGSCLLSLLYGFNRRWADTLGGYSLFRFGGDLSDKVKDNPGFGVQDFKECDELKRLPGLIGDSRPRFHPGHITLVQTNKALKRKKHL